MYRDNLIQDIDATIAYNKSAFSALDSSISAKADLLNSENNSINDNEVYESNEKVVNEAFLNTVAKDSPEWITDYAAELMNVAQQCPLAGGPSVYRARALYMLIDPDMEYNDELTCIQQGYVYRLAHSSILGTCNLYPNPASTNMTLVYSIKAESQLEITDGFGRLVSTYRLLADKNELKFNIGNLDNGMYYYRILNNSNGIKDSGRFVVMK